jgi:hypothetical protein
VLNIVWQSHVPISRGLDFSSSNKGRFGLLSICGYLPQAPVLLAFPRFGIVFAVDFTVDFGVSELLGIPDFWAACA